jgi:lysophospholipase L1-like esterase
MWDNRRAGESQENSRMTTSPDRPRRAWRVLFVASLLMNALVLFVGLAHVVRKGGWAYLMVEMGRRPAQFVPAPHQVDQAAVYRQYPRTEGDVVFVGDSITAGTPFAEVFGPYKNRGIGGDTTDGVLARLDEVLRERPDRVFLMVGTNDVAREASTGHTVEKYRQILRRVKAESPGTKVYVESVLPVNHAVLQTPVDRNPAIRELNSALGQLAGEEGVTFVDLADALGDGMGSLKKEFTTDGLHLNLAGKLALCEALKAYLK